MAYEHLNRIYHAKYNIKCNFMPKFKFNSNQYKYCNLVIQLTYYYI